MRIVLALCLLIGNALLFAEEADNQEEVIPPSTVSINEPIKPENIRILLEKDASEILLEVKGPYYIFNPKDGHRITSGLLGKRFLVHATPNGIKWGEEFPGIYQIRLTPRGKDSSVLINGIQYEGGVVIYGIGNKINVINELSVENYVKSLLTTEFPLPLENEVMSALAILARTDAYYEVGKNKEAFWDIDAKEVRYDGCALTLPNSLIERVVEQTKNLILVHSENGSTLPFPARWNEHSAGKTAAFNAIFRKDAFFSNQHVDAPHAALDRTGSKWTFSMTRDALAKKFHVQGLQSIEHFIDKDSNKTYAIRLHHLTGTKDLSFFEFQAKLGQSLQSNDFKTEIKGETITFTGFGKGHGVGLCLYSASSMAENGDNALKILSKFFPETYLFNLTALPHRDETAQYR